MVRASPQTKTKVSIVKSTEKTLFFASEPPSPAYGPPVVVHVLRRPRGLPRAVEVRPAEGGEAEVARPLRQVAAERVAPLRSLERIRGRGTVSGQCDQII